MTTSYVWDTNAALPVVLQDSAGNRYVYGLDLLTRINGATEEWYLTDGLGSTIGLADGGGAITDTYAYDVFGAQRSHSGTSAQGSPIPASRSIPPACSTCAHGTTIRRRVGSFPVTL